MWRRPCFPLASFPHGLLDALHFINVGSPDKLSSIPLDTTGPNAGNMSEADLNKSELLAKTLVGEIW